MRSRVLVLIAALAAAACGRAKPVPMDLQIHVSSTGACSVVGHAKVACDGVGAYVAGLNAAPSSNIHIEVDRQSQYAFVFAALSSLQTAGFKKVGVEKKDP